ncbi:MAG: PaaI family thioesterase [Rhizobiaceae bacterium]|nr:PaaI family thioesterase [Rhizobiaceae bacterium]
MTSSIFTNPDQKFGTIPLEKMMQFSGLELMQQIIDGELPGPTIARTMNINLTEAGDGTVIFEGIPLSDHYNPSGAVHGGWAATIMDSALGCAVHTKMQAGMGYSTIEFKVHLVRPIFSHTGRVICEGNVVHVGRTIATSEATLKTMGGKLLAHGTETCAIFPIKLPG